MNPRERKRYIIITLLLIFATFIFTHMWTQDWMSREPQETEKAYRYRSKPKYRSKSKYRSKPKYRRKFKPAGKININTATRAQLESLPAIGPVKARAIIENRPYYSTEDIIKAKGIGYRIYGKIKNYITAGEGPSELPSTVPVGKVNINTASFSELCSIPQIGKVRAQAIINGRPYYSINDVLRAKKIGDKTFNKIKDYITAGEISAQHPSAIPEAIDINTASLKQLQTLPGIGYKKAQAIIAGRPYNKTFDIMKVKGIGKATYLKLKDRITVSSRR